MYSVAMDEEQLIGEVEIFSFHSKSLNKVAAGWRV